MNSKYLLDTNILIYYFNGIFDDNNHEIDAVFENSFNISIISKIEFLGWAGFKDDNIYGTAKIFVGNALLFSLDDKVAEETILIRQKHKIKIPDAIIAATAIVNDLELVTNNTDFESLGIQLLNPMA